MTVITAWTRLHDVSGFENIRFRPSTRIRELGGLKKIHSGERFQKDTGSVSGFIGFAWTDGPSHKNICGFKNIRSRLDAGSSEGGVTRVNSSVQFILVTLIFRATPYRVFVTTPYRVFETNSKTCNMLPNPVLRNKSFPVTCYTGIDFARYGVGRKIVVAS